MSRQLLARATSCTVVALSFALLSPAALAHDLADGDIIASVGNGQYDIYDNAGNYIETIDDGLGGFTTGSFYSKSEEKLYATNFMNSVVVVFDGKHPHNVLQTIDTAALGGDLAESVVIASNGDFYIGHAGGDRDIKKFDPAGGLIKSYSVPTDFAGSDWLDLAPDQRTMFYTGEGRLIKRYDVVGDMPLADFAMVPGQLGVDVFFAFRLLPPYDGSGGLVASDSAEIKRLDGSGNVIQTYDIAGMTHNNWFSFNLDPNGTSFWAGGFVSREFARFNLATGALEIGPIDTGSFQFAGLSVVGEITGGNTPPQFDAPTPCGQTVDASEVCPVTFTITASDVNPGDQVTLDVLNAPAGATFNPALPITGAPDTPVSTVFTWLPGAGSAGLHDVDLIASDILHATETCSITIDVGAVSPPATYCTPKSNSCGGTPAIGFSGTPSATATSGFTIDLANAKAPFPNAHTKSGVLLYSITGAANIPFQGGILCLDMPRPSIFQKPTGAGTPGQCDATHTVDMNAFAQNLLPGQSVPDPSLAVCGTSVWVQWTVRDTVPNGLMLSDAVSYTVGP